MVGTQVVNRKPIFEDKNCYLYIFNMKIDQMKRAIHIRCTQHLLYIESHKKSLKQLLFVSVPHLQYQHILLMRIFRRNFKK
jgi:hypothetical protein